MPAFWNQLKNANIIKINMPAELRKQHLINLYGNLETEFLIERFKRIGKRLGNEKMNQAIEAVESRDVETALEIALGYYDKTYIKQITKKEQTSIYELNLTSLDFNFNARLVKELVRDKLV